MYLEHVAVTSNITEASIEEALKNHFNCIFVRGMREGYSDIVRVRHMMTTDEEWESEASPWLFIVISKQKVDDIEEPVCSIYSVADETGDAHQYLMGAAIDPNMIAAACYFAT